MVVDSPHGKSQRLEVSPFLFGGSDLLPTEKKDQTPPVLWAMIAKRAMCAESWPWEMPVACRFYGGLWLGK